MYCEACLGQPVGHLWRNRVFLFAPDQTIRLQLAQALRQDFGRNTRDRPAQHAKAAGVPFAQHIDHMGFPLTPKLAQQCIGCTGQGHFNTGIFSQAGFRGGFHLVTTFAW